MIFMRRREKAKYFEPRGLPVQREYLTLREHDVVREARLGKSNKEIGYVLGLTEGTVKVYMHRISRILGCKNRLEVALLPERLELRTEREDG